MLLNSRERQTRWIVLTFGKLYVGLASDLDENGGPGRTHNVLCENVITFTFAQEAYFCHAKLRAMTNKPEHAIIGTL